MNTFPALYPKLCRGTFSTAIISIKKEKKKKKQACRQVVKQKNHEGGTRFLSVLKGIIVCDLNTFIFWKVVLTQVFQIIKTSVEKKEQTDAKKYTISNLALSTGLKGPLF